MQFNTTIVRHHASNDAFSLIEVVLALAILTVVYGGILLAYNQTSMRAEWSGYSLAAQSLAAKQIEQARSAVWSITQNKNELLTMGLSNWYYNTSTLVGTGYSIATFDLPVSGSNILYATNYVKISMYYPNGVVASGYQVQQVEVDTVWPFLLWGNKLTSTLFTNRIITIVAQDDTGNSTN